jgi:undecaprenyl-diphosphatase
VGPLEALVVGLVGGVADFLPVGGFGHRILVGQILFGEPYDRGFAGVCQISSALAALAALRGDVWSLVLAVVRRNGERRRIGAMLLVSAVAAAFISLPFRDAYLGVSDNLLAVVGVLLLVSGLLLYVAEELGRRTRSLVSLNLPGALLIGLLQVLAVLPGISRTGMAISGGMLVGITREAATRFALLLSIPLLLVAGLWDLSAGQSSSGALEILEITLGASASFVGGFLAIGFLRWYVREFSLMTFAYYLWGVGIATIAYGTLS